MPYRVAVIGSRSWLASSSIRRLLRLPTFIPHTLNTTPPKRVADVSVVQWPRSCANTRRRRLEQARKSARHWLVVATAPDDDTHATCVRAQAWGCIDQSTNPGRFASAVMDIARGRLVYPPRILDRIHSTGGQLTLAKEPADLRHRLTNDQTAFLRSLASGATLEASAGEARIHRSHLQAFLRSLQHATHVSGRSEWRKLAHRLDL